MSTVPESEIDVRVIDRRPPGGQGVGDISCIVEVTHIPTGLIARCGYERSQLKNKRVAVEMIAWGLLNIGNYNP